MRAWRKARRGLALAVMLAGLLTGCASLQAPQSRALLAHPPADLPAQVLLAQTPFHPQTALQCGPAALATVMGAAGKTVSPDELATQVFVPGRGGSLQIEMLAAARRHGLLGVRLPPDLGTLLREVAAGHPAVVLLNLSLPIQPLWHYAVVVGHDLARQEVLLRSGTTPLQRMPMATFEVTWARSGHWAFVTVPPGQLPLTARVDDMAEALAAFERVQPPAAALLGYRAALARWPGHLVLGLGEGNALHALGDTRQAAEAFARVAEATGSAVAWNNLAATRLQLGDRAGALEAARWAVARAEAAEPGWLAAARATLDEVRASVRGADAHAPP